MMFDLPEQYKLEKTFALKNFISPSLSPVNKKKLRETLQSVMLTYQITGETIESTVNERHNCQAILFFDVKLKNLKDATFVANIFQSIIKDLCIIRFYTINNEAYSFAIKRLNSQDSSQIVVDDSFITNELSSSFLDATRNELVKQLSFGSIKNKKDKLSFYYEVMVRTYIVVNKGVYSMQMKFLESNIWFNSNKVFSIYKDLCRIKELKIQLGKCNLNSDKIKMNAEISKIIERIEATNE